MALRLASGLGMVLVVLVLVRWLGRLGRRRCRLFGGLPGLGGRLLGRLLGLEVLGGLVRWLGLLGLLGRLGGGSVYIEPLSVSRIIGGVS